METLNTTEKSTYLKAILGAFIFLTIGILLTSKTINFSESTAILILQVYLLSLVLIAISLNGYYFEKPSNEGELLGKILSFSIILIPTSLIFFVNQPHQELFFFTSFFISICFMFVHGITFKREKENYLLTFLTSVWSLLGVIVLVKDYNLLPARFFNELSFLQLDKIKIIRIILLVGILIHLTIISFVEAIKPENKILEPNPIPSIPVLNEIDSYHILLRPVLWLGYLAILFLNIGIFISNLILAAFRIILDSVLRFGQQVILSLIKLLYGWDSIILFIILYIVCFSIPFIIKVNSSFVLHYINGTNSDFKLLLSQIGLLILAIFLFRLVITFLFCGVRHKPSSKENLLGWVEDFINAIGDNLFPHYFNSKAYIENFTPIIYCLVFYSFFISLASIILTGISTYWNSLFEIQGYSSIGTLTKYCGYLIVIAIFVVIPFIVSKSKFLKKSIAKEESHFVFSKLDWSDLWSKSWILIALLIVMSFFYIMPSTWLQKKRNLVAVQSIDSTKKEQPLDSISIKRKMADEKKRMIR